MALKEYLLLKILIVLFIGVQSVLAWKSNLQQYGSYNLERGPVFYEAYYPHNNEETQSDYQEKRYFDRGAILERSYQVPEDRDDYLQHRFQIGEYQNVGKTFPKATNEYVDQNPTLGGNIPTEDMRNFVKDEDYRNRNDFLMPQSRESNFNTKRMDLNPFSSVSEDPQSLGIKEISSIARRAISRDLENWNMIENYLDRAKFQDERSGTVHPLITEPRGYNTAKERRNDAILRENIQLMKNREDLVDTGSLRNYGLGYDEQFNPERSQILTQGMENRDVMKKQIPSSSYPTENIYQPRPQVINYIFSKKPSKSADSKTQSISQPKEIPKESVPRNYGDNLIRDEMKRSEGSANVKVTSIEVSEVPRHKTRHHHGEWPRRDYSHHRKV